MEKNGSPAGPRPRVIVVDDDDEFRLVVATMLGTEYDVLELESGEGLMDHLHTSSPDLVILDVMLPGKNGFQLCKEIRASTTHHSLPILFLTASHSDKSFVQNVESGGSAFLNKPVTKKQLLNKVQELLAN